MKKILLAFSLIISVFVSKAQLGGEIGARYGSDLSFDFTVQVFPGYSRFHPSASFQNLAGFKETRLALYYDYLFPVGVTKDVRFYAGVGPELYFGTALNFAVGGNFGVEYKLNAPFNIGIDYRPAVVISGWEFAGDNWGVAFRWRLTESIFRKEEIDPLAN